MGIKGLWSLLTPFCEKKSLHEISGETVAVDLAGWVCDSQHVGDMNSRRKLYLRNIFFRTSALLATDVTPIFVLDGDAPELKRDELARRAGKAPTDKMLSRRRFHSLLLECETLLRYMGVSCLHSAGEAEGTCAVLNTQGIVDAVITQDSDCFAYGAKRVYRNLALEAGGKGCLHYYDAVRIASEIDLGRNKMAALAVLCGSDYCAGAAGFSLATAVSVLRSVSEADVIAHLEGWSERPQHYDKMSRQIASGGCRVCSRKCGHKEDRAQMKRELSLRSRVLASGAPFPPRDVLTEFLHPAHPPPLPTPRPPDLVGFVKFMMNKLSWTERYGVEKFLPLFTRWQLAADKCVLPPRRLLATRRRRGIPSYLVQWDVGASPYAGLVPDDQLKDGETPESVWVTCERCEAIDARYPDLVSQLKPTKKPKKIVLNVNRAKRQAKKRKKSLSLVASLRESITKQSARESTARQSLRESFADMTLDDSTDLSLLVNNLVQASSHKVVTVGDRPVRLLFGCSTPKSGKTSSTLK